MRIATYRAQLNAGFTFGDAAAVTGYLARLGVSHLYLSPCLQAAAGSTHGYDVIDHSRLSTELGGESGFGRLAGAATAAGLRQVLDIVPNHLAVSGNAWWWDVLENGPSSWYAGYFDIDWDPPERKLTATVLMPVLADHFGRVLEAGEISVGRTGGSFTVRYRDHRAPVSPRTLDDLLSRAARRAGSPDLAGLAAAHGALPHALLTDPGAVAERHRGKEELCYPRGATPRDPPALAHTPDQQALRERLAALLAARPELAAAVDAEVSALNGDPDALGRLLDRQNYRLAWWATAAGELSYRRFFNIETLAALRAEDPEVFDETHRLVLGLVTSGLADGLRVDHVDGLADPEGYLTRLAAASGGTYVVVEKVLTADEELPGSWAAAGTTGYDFLGRVTQLYTDQAGEEAILGCYARFTGDHRRWEEVARAAKMQIMREDLAAELDRLTSLLAEICERHRRHRDHTRRELRAALAELIASFGVYRGYACPGRPVSHADRQKVAAAIMAARMRRPDLDAELLDLLGRLLVLAVPGEGQFAVRFAQVSAPVMAKGEEDTALHRYCPLISLNEVGCSPAAFGRPACQFHADMERAARNWPESMLTLSTHDTKRSADVRARIGLLAELPRAWEDAVTRWARRNRRHKRGGWPDAGAEYLLYQTLAGAWPIGAERAAAFMAKAAREARAHTSWADPDREYADALGGFVAAILTDAGFVADLESFLAAHRLVERGRITSLAQTTLLLTCPGVPDVYQGTETWDLSLTDPDNRRPVDYSARSALLEELCGQDDVLAGTRAALAAMEAGGPKLWLVHRLLGFRRQRRAAFGAGSGYLPLEVTGTGAAHAVAFARTAADTGPAAVVVVPRLVARLAGDWTDTAAVLPDGNWTDVLTGRVTAGGPASVAALLGDFPVAVLGRPD